MCVSRSLRWCLCFLLLCGWVDAGVYDKLRLTGINIIDRNGLSETICSKEKLQKYTKIDFLSPQPYQKVMRTYKNAAGESVACLTTYYPNGQIRQYLECLNNRAFGRYREWHSNGKIHIQAEVIGGIADLHPSAEAGWLFDGTTYAHDSEGRLEAVIHYEKGLLEGISLYYHANGNVWKECPYHKGVAHGDFLVFTEEGSLLKKQTFCKGQLSGCALRYEPGSQSLLSEEEYKQGKLRSGKYYDPLTKEEIACVVNGKGKQVIYGKYAIIETRQIVHGVPHGEVLLFDEHGKSLLQAYSLINGQKEGEEVFFYPGGEGRKMLLTWSQGILQGAVKTWYPNGALESSKELIQNKKTGILMLYYPEGQVMATEEYVDDLLIKGEYFRPNDRYPYAKVEKGCGTAVFFSATGGLLKKFLYEDGTPVIH
ncbi:MORN repeat variant family protein [Chlamydia trachomatis]|uniref:toxin-antitoxin system YwqK family antitoxin n=1 Tax=Chlamydia trachomatis TaxID=813 RepID=UPI0005E05DB7|nr:toxin-antitoxin system YwqK family antitoxin [Chlamydia trachomatis]CPR41816.1 MORN repeat variant family protein [Chlamydia trachomatis]